MCVRNSLTAEPKENILKIPDLKSFSSIWPLMDTSFDAPKFIESVTNIAKRNISAQEVYLYYLIVENISNSN